MKLLFSSVVIFFFVCQVKAQVVSAEFVKLDSLGGAFKELNKSLKKAKETNNSYGIALAHYKLAIFCKNNNAYTEALHQNNEALVLLQSKKDTLVVNVLNQIGALHLELKNYNYAKDYFAKAITQATTLKDSLALAFSTSNLGSCFEKQHKYAEALNYQNKSLKLYKQLNNSSGLAIVNENIGSIYEDLEDYKLAKYFFEKALAYAKNSKEARLANIYNNLGDVYRKTDNLTKGLEFTKKSLESAIKTNSSADVASAYKDLSKNYNLQGDYKKAHSYLQLFVALDTKNSKQQNANQASALQHIYNSKEKESQIAYLLQVNKVNRAQNIILVILVVTVLALSLIWFMYVQKKRRHSRKEQDYEQQLLKAKLDKKQAEEKTLQKEVYIKTAALSRYSLHLSQKNKMLSNLSLTLKNSLQRSNIDLKRKLKTLIKEIDFNLSQEKEWDEFMLFFKEIHPSFITKISAAAHCKLSPAELRLCILLKLNLSSKEIASILRLTPDSVRVSRYRLRKKLPINAKEELGAYLTTF
ncbi:tetratricopeptide repeat protein [Cellulophaga lytica]|uniref:tetratricopeptide repeat protein n=1 Tax=Cellulophaga lytica TaxID=979 RepID=UPI000B5CBC69|nr:tetratricopeptide repeat protein [Cellulophaga lytica]SNQ43580.1 TPR repeats protein [Cellulophaga lytica]